MIPALKSRTLIDKEVSAYGHWRYEGDDQREGNVTEIEPRSSKAEPVVYVISGLTNSASNIGQSIAVKYYEKYPSRLTEKQEPREGSYVVHSIVDRDTEFERVNKQRIYLLAQKYEHEKTTREDLARLEILKARVRRLNPSVTADEYEALAMISDEVDKIMKEDEEIRKTFNL